jgi:hypothetical protein
MQADELDRLLANEGNISPSPDFTAAVMSNILRETATPRGIGFPWKPVLFGFASAALAIGAGIGLGSESPHQVLAAQTSLHTEWLDSWTANVAAAVANPAAGALVLAVIVALVPLVVYESYQRLRD